MIQSRYRKYSTRQDSERGMALVSLITLLPMLLLLISGFSIIGIQSVVQSRALHRCRQEGLKAQKSTAQKLTSLLNLNPLAQKLRKQRQATRSALAASVALATVEPQVYVAAKNADHLVAHQQQILQARQLMLEHSLAQHLQQSFRHVRRELVKLKAQHLKGSPPQLYLTKTPISSLTPDYRPSPLFTTMSKIQFHWNSQKIVDPSLSRKSTLHDNSLKASCSVGLIERAKHWKATLLAVK